MNFKRAKIKDRTYQDDDFEAQHLSVTSSQTLSNSQFVFFYFEINNFFNIYFIYQSFFSKRFAKKRRERDVNQTLSINA